MSAATMGAMLLPSVPAGVTSVSSVDFYADSAHAGDPQAAPVAATAAGWDVDTLNVAAGRWYGLVRAMKGTTAYSYPLTDPVDLPDDDRLIVSPEAVAVDAGMTLPLNEQQRQTIRSAIIASQASVNAYLGQPLTPTRFVETGRYPWSHGWNLEAAPDLDIITFLSVDAEMMGTEPTGYFTITYLAGIDAKRGAEYEPIREFVKVDAMNRPSFLRMWRTATQTQGEVRSVSAEGQSISMSPATLGGGSGKEGEPGSLPTLASLDRWRIAGRRVYQAPSVVRQFPYQGMLP